MRWQGADELFEELAHLAAHPFARQIFLAGEREHDGGAGTGAAGGEDAGCFIEADRTFAAKDA